MKNSENFIKNCQKNGWLEEGSRNTNLPIIVKVAKTNGLEEQEALDALKSVWDMTKTDINSFKNSWKKFEPDEEYLKDAWKKNLKPAENRLKYIEENHYDLLEYFFKHKDNVCLAYEKKIKRNGEDDTTIITAIETLEEVLNLNQTLENYQYMSIATFKEKGIDAPRNIENAKDNRYYLIESDVLSLDEQKDLAMKMIEFGLPVKSVTESGHKSVHILLKTCQSSKEEWTENGKKIVRLFNALKNKLIDPQNFEPSRLTRLPNGLRRIDDDTMKVQKLIWLDQIKADDDDWSKYTGLVEKVKEFVVFLNNGKMPLFFDEELEKGNFKQIGNEVKASAEYAIDFADQRCPVDDIFYNGKDLYASFKDDRGMMPTKMSVLSSTIVPFIRSDVKKELCAHNIVYDKETKEPKCAKFNLGMLEIPIKSFTFKMTLEKLQTMKNSYEPGFIVEAAKKSGVTKCPSEFTKLLDNLADEKCKKWLINHLACYFWLLKKGFQRNGGLYVLQTVPVFVGPQGTGKTTLAMMIGNAICKDGYRDVSLEQLSNAQFNDFYESGCMAVNEVGSTSLERKANKNALKRWTDPKVTVNKKHLTPYTIDNTAYKVMTANSSVYGVLALDQGENRRWQYIEGGKGKKIKEVIDFELLEKQKIDFFAWVMAQEPDFNEASSVFDTETKLQDRELSKSKIELVIEFLEDWLKFNNWPGFTTKSVKEAYEEATGDRVDAVTDRALAISLAKIYGKQKLTGKPMVIYKQSLTRGTKYWPNPHFKENTSEEPQLISLDTRPLRLDDSEE